MKNSQPQRYGYISFFFPILLVLLIGSCQQAQTQEDNAITEDDRSREVDKLFANWDKDNTPGVSLAIVQDGEIIYKKGYGMANLEYNIPNTPSTIFHIASVSKQFTNFAVLLLAEEGKVDLDADIRTYIPEVPDFGKTITLRHLATHTSGLRDQWNLLALAGWRLDDVITKEHIMKLVAKQEALNFEPGEEYLYCNTGYTLLAEVVSRVSDKSFAEFTQERIFKPLGMTNTLFYDDHEKIVPNRAYSYYMDWPNYKKSVLSYANVGATSLFTTVEDLAQWAVNFEEPVIGDAQTMDEMHTRGILNSGDTITYALGQAITSYRGLKRVVHGGADAGYRTYLARFPEQRFSVMIFSNSNRVNPGGLAMAVADIYLKDQYTETAGGNNNPQNETEEDKPMPGQLSDYEGEYYSPELSTTYHIKVKDDRLVAEHMRHSDIDFGHKSGNAFRSNTWYFREAQFERNDQGQVTAMLVSSGRVRNLRFERVK